MADKLANKQYVRVTKEFHFEMAHALWKYDGPCKTIHGHSYKLSVTVKGVPNSDESSPKLGMVIDFGLLKSIVNSEIVSKFDHALVISEKANFTETDKMTEMFDHLIISDYQPTCENLIIDIANKIKKRLPDNLILHSLKLNETANSYAEWYQEDNKD